MVIGYTQIKSYAKGEIMKKIYYGIGGLLLIIMLGGSLFWYRHTVLSLLGFLPITPQLPAGALIVWNKTNNAAEVTIRPYHGRNRFITLAPSMRGYFVFDE